ncbi:MAG: hypothetical protein K0R72_55 [Clostridia bacterium]|jgi:hypothetical protein|nr:hypothetical protein [Clostridia bacterium]
MISLNSFIYLLKNTLPTGLDDISKAKYLYIRLGEIISFDPLYSFGSSKDRYRIYNNIQYKYDDLNELFESKLLICKSISYIYKYILNEFEINSYVRYDNPDDNHVFNIIITQNNIKISADVQRDLEFIQTKSKTRYFDFINSTLYDQVEIDKKIGYLQNDNDYFDIKLLEFKNLLKENTSLISKVESIFNFLFCNNNINNLKFSENIKYYKYVLKEILDYREFNRLYFSICYEICNNKQKYIPIICIRSNPSTIFIYSKKNHKYDLISEIELLKKLKSKLLFIQRGSIYIMKKEIISTTNLNKIL